MVSSSAGACRPAPGSDLGRVSEPPLCRLPPGERVELALVRAETGAPPTWPTRVELEHRGGLLAVHFDCVDEDPWGTLVERDAPLWTEEAVEVFIAPGAATPRRYFEFEVSPLGALFDAQVLSPHGDRRELRVDAGWDCAGLAWSATRRPAGWSAEIRLPLAVLASDGAPPAAWRFNCYRIERPRPGGRAVTEYSAWSPTLVTPADFHRPARFGRLALG